MERAAIKYILDRIQRDADLRHHMIHTEAFRLLCAAEAAALGVDAEQHEQDRLKWLGKEPCMPQLVRLRGILDEAGIEY